MTTQHQCDPTVGALADDHPLTMSRVLRLLMARLDTDTDLEQAISHLFTEVGTCPNCLISMVIATAGITTELMMALAEPAELISRLDARLAGYLDHKST